MIIVYYDRQLKSSEENINNFTKLRKAFYENEIYGVDTYENFIYLLSLFDRKSQNYYIIASGSVAKGFIDYGYEHYKYRIMAIYIYCLDINEHLPLKKACSRISIIENENFDNIIKDIQVKEFSPHKEENILRQYSSFFLLEEYFLKAPSQIHEKICEYFDKNYNKPSFDKNTKANILNLLNIIAQSSSEFRKTKKILENIKDEKDLIKY